MGKRYGHSVIAPLLAKPWPSAQLAFEKLTKKIFAEGDPDAVYDTLAPVVEAGLTDPMRAEAAGRILFEAGRHIGHDPPLDPRWSELAFARWSDAPDDFRASLGRLVAAAPHPEHRARLLEHVQAHPEHTGALLVLAEAREPRALPIALDGLARTSNPYAVVTIAQALRRLAPEPPADRHPWHAWTEARQRTPSAAPRWGRSPESLVVYTRQRRYDADGQVDPAVEAARRSAR